ncbi:MAG TPA: UvrD-helicase domain-containing protein, partial [Candidatus Polarisedimenticolia bacterium]|nr:UvrD-helicase domain-containing protein [Candidatus Polarisedimenticolia bacterium]
GRGARPAPASSPGTTRLDHDGSDLLSQLNEQQREAVLTTEGPVLVLAGAGSGKTRVLTYRLAWLIRSLGIDPHGLVAVTFTNKAAQEMKSRIASLLQGDPGGLRMGTFHSLCLRMLRVEAERLGYSRDFVVFDTADQTAVIREVAADLRLDTERFPPRALLHRISSARNRFVLPEEIAAALKDPQSDVALRAWEAYAKRLRSINAMDFDDLILNVLALFREHPGIERKYRERTQYLLVDEYQDTNRSQYELVRSLSAATRNLCVVGDDAQSIYRFRGADIGNILRFNEDYSDAKVVKLTRNYRSTGRILKAAGNVIRRNRGRIEKELWTENPEGAAITWLQAATDRDEAAFVADQIRALRRGPDGHDLSDIALLYRTNAQSRLLEEALLRAGLPYRIYGGLRFYDRKEIKDLMAYLRLAANPADDVSLRRVLNVPPRGLGKVTLESLEEAARAEGIGLLASLEKAAVQTPPSRASRSLKGLVDLLAALRRMAAEEAGTSAILGELVRRLDYQEYLKRAEPGDAESRLENVGQLVAAAQEREAAGQGTLQEFLDGAALVSDVESVTGDTGVNLMTLHCAKGLEFPVVFMVGMEENLFPHVRSMQAADNEEIEEERRLCYVGMTRAMRRLILSCAAQRRSFGSMMMNEPSRFVAELGAGMLDDISPDWRTSYGSPGAQAGWPRRGEGSRSRPAGPGLGDEDISDHPPDDEGGEGRLRAGMRVYHAQFGYGTVEDVEGAGDRQKATVRFPGLGRKKLMTRFAKLQVTR